MELVMLPKGSHTYCRGYWDAQDTIIKYLSDLDIEDMEVKELKTKILQFTLLDSPIYKVYG